MPNTQRDHRQANKLADRNNTQKTFDLRKLIVDIVMSRRDTNRSTHEFNTCVTVVV